MTTPTIEVDPYGGTRWVWIHKHNIEYEIVETFVDTGTFEHLPCKIKFKHDKDYTWYLLSCDHP